MAGVGRAYGSRCSTLAWAKGGVSEAVDCPFTVRLVRRPVHLLVTAAAAFARSTSSPLRRRDSNRPASPPGPDGAIWFTEEHGQQDRADHDRRRAHRRRSSDSATAGRQPAETPSRSPWARTDGSGSPRSAPTRSARMTTAPVRSSTSGSGSSARPTGSSRARTAALVHPVRSATRIGADRRTGAARSPSSGRRATEPGDITVGPDGRLWFTQSRRQDRPDRPTATERHDHAPDRPVADPSGITHPAASLWFTESAPTRSPDQHRRRDHR